VPPAHPFQPDPPGGFSRTIFATDEDADFKAVIRDFSFPPDGRPHTIAFPSAAVVHRLSGFGAVSVSNQQLLLTPRARIAVPAGAPIKVTNSGDEPVVIRALIVEAK
jgi:quercetin dioxygenase-like cupin family protein